MAKLNFTAIFHIPRKKLHWVGIFLKSTKLLGEKKNLEFKINIQIHLE